MMFRFVVRYLGFLKHVPLLAWLLDALIGLWNYAFNPSILKSIDRIESEVSQWQDVCVSLHKFGGIQFNYCGQEIGHIHSNGILDILFDRETKYKLMENGFVDEHHSFPGSGWISCCIASPPDVVKAIGLLGLSCKMKGLRHGL